MNALQQAAPLVGRILIAVIFLMSGIEKIGGFSQTMGYMASKGLPMASVLLAITIVIEVVGALMIIVGWKARWAAVVFFLWLIPVTYTFHNFWGAPPEQVQLQTIQFFKNLAIMGAMLLLYAFGPGPYSVDKR